MIPDSTTTVAGRAAEMLDRIEESLAGILDAETDHWLRTDPSAAGIVEVLRSFLRGGKRLRPAFCVWGFLGAAGEPPGDAAVATASALELLHAFALIHDDVMDGSATRRGHPSVHEQFVMQHRRLEGAGEPRRFGEGMAILAGDLARRARRTGVARCTA